VLNVTWESLFIVQCWMLPESHALVLVLSVTWASRFILQCSILLEGHALLSSAECYLRVTLDCPVLNVTLVTLYFPVLNITREPLFIVQCWMLPGSHSWFRVLLPESHALLLPDSHYSSVEYYLKSSALLSSAECYLRVTLVHCCSQKLLCNILATTIVVQALY
jgi:hypothetical protein